MRELHVRVNERAQNESNGGRAAGAALRCCAIRCDARQLYKVMPYMIQLHGHGHATRGTRRLAPIGLHY